ncbi:MAG: ABC transporter permease subunit [Firmicutes bacterium]|nr:ABC transporter permease subunit [Bacillota bacterium]
MPAQAVSGSAGLGAVRQACRVSGDVYGVLQTERTTGTPVDSVRAVQVAVPWRRATGPNATVLSAISLLSLLGAWLLASCVLPARVLPGPSETLQFLWQEWERGRLLMHVSATIQRVLVSFALAMGIGVAVGLLMGVSRAADRLLGAWLVSGLSIPRIVVIVGAYILIGLNETAAITAIAAVVVPTVVAQVREGARALDPKLVEMARAFRRPAAVIVQKVVAPQLFPYLAGTGRAAMSLAWKMVVFAELMGRTNGVGYQISFYFQMFDMRGILAYGLVMIVVLAVVDYVIMAAWERYAFRWRRTPMTWIG